MIVIIGQEIEEKLSVMKTFESETTNKITLYLWFLSVDVAWVIYYLK